jgi:photosystem II stability/assembly factor-like uncharacterized protein
MRSFYTFFILLVVWGCTDQQPSHNYSSVDVRILFNDSVSIRALEVMQGSIGFAGNGGVFGAIDLKSQQIRAKQQRFDTIFPEFRAIGHTQSDFFMLSAGRPALLFKTGNQGLMELVYQEDEEGVFYDAMSFWNNMEGLAVGDEMNGCLSILITRDGGNTWQKMPCSELPEAIPEEGAFAASNTNIAISGDHTWIGTTESRIFYSPDKGQSWDIFTTPIKNSEPTEGIYTLDFYNDQLGVALGGDYTKPDSMNGNKALTRDGGKTWKLLADGNIPGYKSCVQFVPSGGGKEMVAVGFTGITYSQDFGDSWVNLSEEPFYTLRFINDSTAYAAGKHRIGLLSFE